jgi:predicted enzyme related to lactoylglutathione lyase
MTLAQVLVFVKDLPRLHAFYRDALGLATLDESDGIARLDAGGVVLVLHAIPPEYAAGITIASPPVPRSDTPIKLIFATDDVAAARQRVVAHGGQLRDRDETDPEGNVFRLAPR